MLTNSQERCSARLSTSKLVSTSYIDAQRLTSYPDNQSAPDEGSYAIFPQAPKQDWNNECREYCEWNWQEHISMRDIAMTKETDRNICAGSKQLYGFLSWS